MPAASMPYNNPLYNWLRSIQWILSTERPKKVSGPFGDFDVEYHLDLDANEGEDLYALIGFMLPDDEHICAELEGDTYGIMTGIRIYLETET
jgi:hypothetical protein